MGETFAKVVTFVKGNWAQIADYLWFSPYTVNSVMLRFSPNFPIRPVCGGSGGIFTATMPVFYGEAVNPFATAIFAVKQASKCKVESTK
jgi:hypothetical protein